MKQFRIGFLAALFSALLFSCNNKSDKTTDSERTEDTSVTTTPVDTPSSLAFTPFDATVITHTVKDYGAWKPLFDADSVNRKAAGLELFALGRSADNPNHVIIVLKTADREKAKSFASNPKLKEVMEKAGVISKPSIQYYNVIRLSNNVPINHWVTVTHKVKDFDAWVKVFDSEGPAQRAIEGMTDLGLARGIDDPNLVHVVLAITDEAKAKAALNSDAKKKIMESAGVIEKPQIEYFKVAQ